MREMKQRELKDKNVDQLKEDLNSLKKEAFNLRFVHSQCLERCCLQRAHSSRSCDTSSTPSTESRLKVVPANRTINVQKLARNE